MTLILKTKQLSFGITGGNTPAIDILRKMAPGFPTPGPAENMFCDINSHIAAGRKTNPLSPAVSLPRTGVVSPATPSDGSKLPDGWSGQTFIHFGKKYVIATSPLVPSQDNNFIRELRTYCFDDDKQAAPSEKLTRIVTGPLKPLAVSKYTGGKSITLKPTDKKCLFCGKLITWGNKKPRYCSEGCRTAWSPKTGQVVKIEFCS